jgi:hypothetical protein
MLLIEKLDPKLMKSSTLSAEPMRAAPYRLNEDPSLTKLLHDTDDPVWTKSNNEQALPRRVKP